MRLDRAGREFATWTFTGVPDDATPPEVWLNDAWHPMTWVGAPGPERAARVLIAGPDADPGNAIVLPARRHTPKVRLVDSTEVIVRDTDGSIDVT